MTTTSGRLLALLSLLQARRDWPGSVLAERLQVSDRTVRRDVDRLRALGYPIRATLGPDGGYRLGAGADLPPLLFDDDQAVALALALQLAPAAGAGIQEASARALATVRQVMPSRLRHRIDVLQVASLGRGTGGTGGAEGTADAGPAATADPAVLLLLAGAVRDQHVVRLDHTAAGDDGPGQARRVEPHHVVARAGRWYLLAWDLDRADWRTFRVDRVVPRTPTGPRFVPRDVPGGVEAFVTARFKGSSGADEWPCRGEVVLHLPVAEVAPYAGDALVEALGPRRTRLVAGSWSWAGLVAWLTRFDTDIDVVGPAELRVELARVADRLARAASDPGVRPS